MSAARTPPSGEGRGKYPPTCALCGEKVKMTGDRALAFMWTPEHGLQSFHAEPCWFARPKLRAVQA